MSQYYSLRGRFYLAEIVSGAIGAAKWAGNMPKFDIKVDADIITHNESWSGERTEDFTLTKSRTVTGDATIEELTPENKALVLNGENHEITGATVANRSLGTVTVGTEIILGAYKLTSVTVTDSAATPATVASSKYELDHDFGTIKFNDVTGLTMPLKISYTSGNVTATTIASNDSKEYMLFFKGINTADNNKKVAVELWRIKKEPSSTFPLINEELASYDVTFRCLADPTKKADPVFGLYGRFIEID